MGFFDFLKRKGADTKDLSKRSGYAEYALNPSFSAMFGNGRSDSAHKLIVDTLKGCRATSRQLAINNPYVANALEQSRVNVIGSGLKLQLRDKPEDNTTSIDALRSVEKAWSKACKKITLDDRYSFKVVTELVNKHEFIDGEVFVRLYMDDNAGLKLQIIEPEYIPESLNYDKSNGNMVRCGIEFDGKGRVVGYHIYRRHPDETVALGTQNQLDFIPAEQIVHVYAPARPSQVRGYPRLNPAIFKLMFLDKFEDAHLAAATKAAMSDMWFEQRPEAETDLDDKGNPILPTLPLAMGGIPVVPSSLELHYNESKFPDQSHASVIKSSLHAVGSGLGVNYNKLALDFEKVNYSSLREAKLMEKASYTRRREFIIEQFCQPIFEKWLEYAAIVGLIDFKLDRDEVAFAANWRGDGWEWVDPEKDAKALSLLLQLGVMTPSEVLAERGKDLREHLAALKQDEEIIKANGFEPNALFRPINSNNQEVDINVKGDE